MLLLTCFKMIREPKFIGSIRERKSVCKSELPNTIGIGPFSLLKDKKRPSVRNYNTDERRRTLPSVTDRSRNSPSAFERGIRSNARVV